MITILSCFSMEGERQMEQTPEGFWRTHSRKIPSNSSTAFSMWTTCWYQGASLLK
jgi:hypothetical protein